MMWWVGGLFLLLGLTRLAVTEQRTVPQRGPRQNETHRFRYQSSSQPGLFLYCRYCPKRALDDSTYSYMQVTSCLKNYPYDVVWQDVLTPYEWENKKFPLCNEGETPGCGVPPAITNIDWECEEGYSGENHSVYFPCLGRCNVTTEVHYHAYCNATLQWEITEVITDNKCEVTKDDAFKNVTLTGMSKLVELLLVVGLPLVLLIILAVFCVLCQDRLRKFFKKKENELKRVDIEMQPVQPMPRGNLNNANRDQRATLGPSAAQSADSSLTYGRAIVHKNGIPSGSRTSSRMPRVSFETLSGSPGSSQIDSSQTNLKQVIANDLHNGRSMSSVAVGTDPDYQTIPKEVNITRNINRNSNVDSLDTIPKVVAGGTQEGNSTNGWRELDSSHTEIQTDFLQSHYYSSPLSSMSSHQSSASCHQNSTQNNLQSLSNISVKSTNSSQSSGSGSVIRNLFSSTRNVHNDCEDDRINEHSALLPPNNNSSMNNPPVEMEMERLLSGQSSGEQQNDRRNLDEYLVENGVTGLSLKVPVEHELPPEVPPVDDDDRKPIVTVLAKGLKQDDDRKYYISEGQPFSVLAKPSRGEITKFIIQREGNGPAFKGKEMKGPILHIGYANEEDSGIFSWSLLLDDVSFTGTLEIVVRKEEERRPSVPLGASAGECTVETDWQAIVKNQSLPSQPFADAPSLNIDSVTNDPAQQSLQQKNGADSQPVRAGYQHVGADSQTSGADAQQDAGHQSRCVTSLEGVKGERCEDEPGQAELGLITLDPGTISDEFMTREGPSGMSSAGSMNNTGRNPPCGTGNGGQEPGTLRDGGEETSRKYPIDVTRPINCSCLLKDITEGLREWFAQQPIDLWKKLARHHGIDESVLMALGFLKDNEESQIIKSIIDLLAEQGLRIGHVMDCFCHHILPTDILRRNHSDCPFCTKFYS